MLLKGEGAETPGVFGTVNIRDDNSDDAKIKGPLRGVENGKDGDLDLDLDLRIVELSTKGLMNSRAQDLGCGGGECGSWEKRWQRGVREGSK